MRIGVLKEIKNSENRVAVIPATVAELIRHGHEVHIEHDAGLGSGFKDEDYSQAGAIIEADAESVWKTAELLYKVSLVCLPWVLARQHGWVPRARGSCHLQRKPTAIRRAMSWV